MKTCDYLLNKGYINRKQKEEVLKEQQDQKQQGVEVEIGQILLEKGFLTVDVILETLTEQSKEEDMVKPTEIGEGSKFTFDLKFIATIGVVIVSACGLYFSITGQVEDNAKEIDNIKSMGDLKIISYKMDEYSETFKDLKALANTLSPMASDLTYIKEELAKLKNKKIDIPDVDLSGIEDCKNKLDALSAKISAFETRLTKIEKTTKGRF